MSEHKEPIPSMIYNASVGGHVTNSQQIIDEDYNIEQKDINKEVLGEPYNVSSPNGMGRIVLKKNDNFKEVVEAQTNGNTIFVIKYDFDLDDDVAIPANCVLEFDGGSLRNGNIQCSDSCVINNGVFNECSLILGDNNIVSGCEIYGDTKLFLVEITNINNVALKNCNIHTNKLRYDGRNCSPVFIKQSTDIDIVNCEVYGSAFDNRTAGGDYYDDENGDFTHSVIYAKFSSKLKIVNCTLHDGANECVYLYRCNECIIQGNEIFDSFYSAIAGDFGHSMSYIGNHCHHTGATCITTTDYEFIICDNIVHHNNFERTPYTTSGIGAGHNNQPSPTGESKRVGLVSNNLVYDYLCNGITSDSIENITISGNSIIDSLYPSDGIGLYVSNTDNDANIIISNNIIKNGYKAIVTGTRTGGTGNIGVKISNNTIETVRTGIECPTCKSLEIYNNNILDCRDGIALYYNENADISNNTVKYKRNGIDFISTGIFNVANNNFKKLSNDTDYGAIYFSATDVQSDSLIINLVNNTFFLSSLNLIYFNTQNLPDKANYINTISNIIISTQSITGINLLYNRSEYVTMYFKDTLINGRLWTTPRVTNDANLPLYRNNCMIGEKCIIASTNDVDDVRIWTGRRWIKTAGTKTTAADKGRPYFEDGVLRYFIGFEYLETDNGITRPIYKTATDGHSWVDSTGTPV